MSNPSNSNSSISGFRQEFMLWAGMSPTINGTHALKYTVQLHIPDGYACAAYCLVIMVACTCILFDLTAVVHVCTGH